MQTVHTKSLTREVIHDTFSRLLHDSHTRLKRPSDLDLDPKLNHIFPPLLHLLQYLLQGTFLGTHP